MKRREVLRLLSAGAMTALGVACASPTPSAPIAAGTPVPPQSSGPRAGGTLRLGTLGDLVSLDGHASRPFDTLYQVWDLLGAEDDHLNLQPVLAETFDWSTDTGQLTFNLRKAHGPRVHER